MIFAGPRSRRDRRGSRATCRHITIAALAGMGILLLGLWFVQVISYRQYAENQKAQSFRTVRIPAIRGKILDGQVQLTRLAKEDHRWVISFSAGSSNDAR